MEPGGDLCRVPEVLDGLVGAGDDDGVEAEDKAGQGSNEGDAEDGRSGRDGGVGHAWSIGNSVKCTELRRIKTGCIYLAFFLECR